MAWMSLIRGSQLIDTMEDNMKGWSPDQDKNIPAEDQAKIRLTNWFESYNASVYWEKSVKGEYGRSTFTSSRTAEKPDLLIDHSDWGTLALEVKTGNDGTSIYTGAVQVTRYWWIYELGEDEYRVDGKPVNPDIFVLATGNSPLGRLYNDAKTKDRLKTASDMSEGRAKWAVRRKQRPKTEHSSSETTTGIIWRIAKQRIIESNELKNDYEPSIGIGSLYSNSLDDSVTFPPGIETADPGINYQRGSGTVWKILD